MADSRAMSVSPSNAAATTTGGALPGAGGFPVIPDYEVLQLIGRGAYGEVWLARSTTGLYRAVKVVRRSAFDHDRPFEREFEGIKKFEPISHSESQVHILHVGRNDAAGYFYYVMELADDAAERSNGVMESGSDGITTRQHSNTPSLQHSISPASYVPKTLKHELRTRGRLGFEECVQIGLALTNALAHLHKNGLVHRDVKPSNIIFVNGVPKLADIGLVTSVDATRSFVGTEGYLAPEGPGTSQADLYSLGKVLYEISTGLGRREFPALPSDIATVADRQHISELNAVIVKSSQADPTDRYRSAEDMRADFELLHQGRSVKRKRRLEHGWSVGVKAGLAISLLALLVAVGVFLLQRPPSDTYLHSAVPEVNNLVDQGNFCVRSLSAERLRHAADLFKKAIALDPQFVPAYFGLYRTYIRQGAYEWDAPPDFRQEFRAVANKLGEIGPSYAESLAASAGNKWMDWQFREALAEAQGATQIRAASKEGQAAAHARFGYYLLQSGKPAEALKEYRKAEKLTSSDPLFHHHLGHPYFAQRQFDLALAHYRASVELEPRHHIGHVFMGRVYEEKGDFIAAIREFEIRDLMVAETEAEKAERKRFYDDLRDAVRQGSAKRYWERRLEIALEKPKPELYKIATLYARLGKKDEAYAWLKKACEQKAFDQGPLFDLCWDHDDEQFKAIVRGIGLLQ